MHLSGLGPAVDCRSAQKIRRPTHSSADDSAGEAEDTDHFPPGSANCRILALRRRSADDQPHAPSDTCPTDSRENISRHLDALDLRTRKRVASRIHDTARRAGQRLFIDRVDLADSPHLVRRDVDMRMQRQLLNPLPVGSCRRSLRRQSRRHSKNTGSRNDEETSHIAPRLLKFSQGSVEANMPLLQNGIQFCTPTNEGGRDHTDLARQTLKRAPSCFHRPSILHQIPQNKHIRRPAEQLN